MGPGWAADPRLSFQKSIRPQVVTTFELPGCYDMWTVIAPVRKEQVCVPRLATSSWRCWPAPGLLGVPTGRRASLTCRIRIKLLSVRPYNIIHTVCICLVILFVTYDYFQFVCFIRVY